MEKVRGILMIGAGGFAFYRGLVMHGRPNAWLAFLLGAAAIGLGIFRLTRRSPPRRLV